MSAADFAIRARSAGGIADNIGMARTSSVVNMVRLALPSVERSAEGNSRASQTYNRDCGRDQGRSEPINCKGRCENIMMAGALAHMTASGSQADVRARNQRAFSP